MKVGYLKFGDSLRTLEVPASATVAEVLLKAGEDPRDLKGYVPGLFGVAGAVPLDRKVGPEEIVMLVPDVKGG